MYNSLNWCNVCVTDMTGISNTEIWFSMLMMNMIYDLSFLLWLSGLSVCLPLYSWSSAFWLLHVISASALLLLLDLACCLWFYDLWPLLSVLPSVCLLLFLAYVYSMIIEHALLLLSCYVSCVCFLSVCLICMSLLDAGCCVFLFWSFLPCCVMSAYDLCTLLCCCFLFLYAYVFALLLPAFLLVLNAMLLNDNVQTYANLLCGLLIDYALTAFYPSDELFVYCFVLELRGGGGGEPRGERGRERWLSIWSLCQPFDPPMMWWPAHWWYVMLNLNCCNCDDLYILCVYDDIAIVL